MANLLRSFERWGYFDEILSLLEAALRFGRGHVSAFRMSGIVKSNYLDREVTIFTELLILCNKCKSGKRRHTVITVSHL